MHILRASGPRCKVQHSVVIAYVRAYVRTRSYTVNYVSHKNASAERGGFLSHARPRWRLAPPDVVSNFTILLVLRLPTVSSGPFHGATIRGLTPFAVHHIDTTPVCFLELAARLVNCGLRAATVAAAARSLAAA